MQDAGTGETAVSRGQRTVGAVSGGRQSGRALRMGFVLDVAGYGTRTVTARDEVQQRLKQLVVAILEECGLTLDARVVDHQWTGDGINGVLPSDIDPPVVLGVLVRSLAAALSADNARHADRIRLRMAVGVGLIERTAAGFGGPMIVDISRLVDSAALRAALTDEPAADLAVALSDQAYTLIVQPGYPGIPTGQFGRAKVASKEFSGAAWIWLSTRQWSAPAYLQLGPTDPWEIGGYRIVARLGAGQAGPVYLASSDFGGDGLTGTDAGWAAVKVFDQRLLADPVARRRLTLGAVSACVAREPHIASLIDSDIGDRDQPWVASTLVRGPSLASVVAETGRLPAATAGWVALGLARALTTLHDAGFSHGAVSPRNVVLDADGPVLTDLGMNRARLVNGQGGPGDDVLMLGATVFFAATGRSPWGDSGAATVPVPPPDPADRPGEPDLTECPPLLAPIVSACLAADPEERPDVAKVHAWLADEIGQRPQFWLPDPVAARVAEYESLASARRWFRWPRT
jgi:hypothetical protein